MTGDYTLHSKGGVGVLTSELLSDLCVEHGFTTRIGGHSKPPLDTLNLGFNRPEPRDVILENYKALCNSYGLDFDSLVLVTYVHGTNVLEVTKKDRGRGITKESLPDCDGIVTNDPDVTLFTLHADCSAFFVVDPVKRAIGLAHAGWRGTIGRIGEGLIEKMECLYGSKRQDMYAVVSPCICGKCYEVSDDVAEKFIKEFGDDSMILPHMTEGKKYLDIRRAGLMQFTQAGITDEHLGVIPVCTYEHENLLYSFRRNGKGNTGAMGAFLKLK